MWLRKVGVVLLIYLTACAGTQRALYPATDPAEAELAAVRYEFLMAEAECGRVVRLLPLEDNTPLEVGSAAEFKRQYLDWCQQEYGGGDCLGLLADGPTLTREDLHTLGLALALKDVLRETRVALKGMVSPQELVKMLVWTGCLYLALWLLPEPTSKLLAAGLTLALLAWLPVHTLWGVMDGWGRLVHEVDRATSFEQVEEASAKFSQLLGQNTANVLVMVLTAVVTGGAAKFTAQLPKLPGYVQAQALGEAQGLSLAGAGEVEVVAAAENETFTLMVRRPGERATAAAEEAAAEREGSTVIIRHQGGNRQVGFNGQRWHLDANRSVHDIPAKDPVGDALVAAARRIARTWSRSDLRPAQRNAIKDARDAGEYLRAHLMERMFRGQWVEEQLSLEFTNLKWNQTGVDAVDPVTGLQYEILTGTDWNMQLHGRRMAEEFFRMITF